MNKSKEQLILNEIHFATKVTKNVPGLTQSIGYVQENFCYSLVMEYMPVGDLFTYIGDNDPPALPVRYKMVYDIAKGLEYLHANGIVHRDVKSPNIFLTEKLEAKLGDYDLMTEVKSALNLKDSLGSPQWLAPELVNGESHTQAADIYGVGMILWEVISWKEPYAGRHLFKVISLISKGENEIIPEDCPPKVSALIKCSWSKEKEKRPNANQFVHEMGEILEEEKQHLTQRLL